jgi:hypothetical protein
MAAKKRAAKKPPKRKTADLIEEVLRERGPEIRKEVAKAVAKRRRMKNPLDAKQSKRNRDKALEVVEVGASREWLGDAYRLARKVAETFRFFTTDDVWKAGLSKPDEPRALGPVMRSLERDGIIEATEHFKNTAQKTRNAAPVRLWRSCVYMGKTNK